MMFDAFGCLGLPTLDALEALCLKPVSCFRDLDLFGVWSLELSLLFQNLIEASEENKEE